MSDDLTPPHWGAEDPERVWVNSRFFKTDPIVLADKTEYVRADLYDALAQQRDELQAALEKSVAQISDLAAALGRAEGKLDASELPGIIDGWKARAEKAEAEVERLRDELRRMEGFDVCTCGPCALHQQRKEGDE